MARQPNPPRRGQSARGAPAAGGPGAEPLPPPAASAEAYRAAARRSAAGAESVLSGEGELPPLANSPLQAAVASVARRISSANARMNNNSTLETMGRMRRDSLLDTPVSASPGGAAGLDTRNRRLKEVLHDVERSMVTDIFFGEKKRVDDYVTYDQIYDLVVQVSEAIQTYTDNIVSPDDFTKRDLDFFYSGPDDEDLDGMTAEVRRKCKALVAKYNLDDRIEAAIMHSLTKGDYFVGVLNLRQELEGLLTESPLLAEEEEMGREASLLESCVPGAADPDVLALLEDLRSSEGASSLDLGGLREAVGHWLAGGVAFQEDASAVVAALRRGRASFQDLPGGGRRPGARPGAAGRPSLAGSQVRGSVVKMIPPENVVKMYQEDTLFGYYVVEVTGQTIADFGRNLSGDQSAVVRSLDQNLNVRALGATVGTGPESARDALINRVIVKTLITRLGRSDFLRANPEYATDAYAIIQRHRRENRRVTITYYASDQIVHFRPDGAAGYGVSLLARVKFVAKLYIGALTNAFMRNSIRRPEKLVFYVDAGTDLDGSQAVQSFIRTVKQSEVKFSNLRDITTTINHIGEFHDFYIPTFNGERPVEIETLNMGPAGEVDNDFLDYLRKAIISGMGVPASFLGYAEEVAFARTLTMDNGRFTRRSVRLQKHYGQQGSQLVRALYTNEYLGLEEIVGPRPARGDPPRDEDQIAARPGAGPPGGPSNSPVREAAAGRPRGGGDGGAAADGSGADGPDPREADVSFIELRFPTPSTLGLTNAGEAIQAATPVIDFIVSTMVPDAGAGDDQDAAVLRGEFRKMVTRERLPQLPWDSYDKLLEEAERKADEVAAKRPRAQVLAPPAPPGTDGQGTGQGPGTGELQPGLNNASPGI